MPLQSLKLAASDSSRLTTINTIILPLDQVMTHTTIHKDLQGAKQPSFTIFVGAT